MASGVNFNSWWFVDLYDLVESSLRDEQSGCIIGEIEDNVKYLLILTGEN
jgi:hypothetical protein